MDIFVFTNPNEKTKMQYGRLINGIKQKTWIERYQAAGEFTFVAPIRTGIIEQMPKGAFVSHVNTREIMIVENHEIKGQRGSEVQVTVTGSSFETCLDQRIVGSNQKFPNLDIKDYDLKKGLTWHQIVNLIRDHIDTAHLVDPMDAIPHVLVSQVVDPTTYVGPILDYALARGSLYEHVQTLLKIDNLGIKTIRPPDKTGGPNTTITVHRGVDRSKELVFNYETGEIENIDYLFSIKPKKTAALVSGTWVELMVFSPDGLAREVGYDRREMHVSATDIDSDHDTAPEGEALELVKIALWYRGMKALNAQHEVALKSVELPKGYAHKYQYRKDYDLGDLVGIRGGYMASNEPTDVLRVTEYVETEDENGFSSYPTLALDPPPTETQ
jgi:hypothetical protein